MGLILHTFATGWDVSPVQKSDHVPNIKSVGNSATTPRDLENEEDVKLMLILLAESVPKALPSADEMFVVIKRLLSRKQRCAWHQPASSRQMAIPTGIRICKIKIAGIP